ncbi:hypothetical protein [Chitinophaga sp. ARDCPP14]|uniref:hypothetical protein n=1 Tax=Chitinophaga sp. ARDCPP14 TaxID=3391139 RepID=UPI003F5262E5
MRKKLILPHSRNFKHIEPSLKVLQKLNKGGMITLQKPGSSLHQLAVNLVKNTGKGFLLTFPDDKREYHSLLDIENVGFQSNIGDFKCGKIIPVETDFNTVTAEVSTFYSLDFSLLTASYFRLMIPFESNLHFHYFVDRKSFKTKNKRSGECVGINYEELQLDMYIYRAKDAKQYMVLDTTEKVQFKAFMDYCFDALVALGYVSGHFIQNEGYFFQYPNMEMDHPTAYHYSEFRKSCQTSFTPIYANAYSYIRDTSMAEQVHKELQPLSIKEFSLLCQKINQSIEFSAAILLIIEACSASQVMMPAAFMVALEALTNEWVNGPVSKVKPIHDTNKAKAIKKELMAVLQSHTVELDLKSVAILRNKINDINRPVNADQLSKPFAELGFTLSPDDLEVIISRNDFLHGRITLIDIDKGRLPAQYTDELSRHVYHCCLRIYTLLTILILRQCGYEGKMVNYPKIHEHITGKKLDEPYFRDVCYVSPIVLH